MLVKDPMDGKQTDQDREGGRNEQRIGKDDQDPNDYGQAN